MASVSRDVRGCLRTRVSANVGWCGVLWLLSFLCVWYVLLMFHVHILMSYIYELTHTWLDVCWCYVVVWLGWCGIRMQAETLLVCTCGM